MPLVKKKTVGGRTKAKPAYVIEGDRAIIQKKKVDSDAGTDIEPVPISKSVNDRLYEYQREGLKFLFRNFRKKCGCILADDMGLGKTVQISAFLTAMRLSGYIRNAIIVAPTTLLDWWESEI